VSGNKQESFRDLLFQHLVERNGFGDPGSAISSVWQTNPMQEIRRSDGPHRTKSQSNPSA
jgi:hypothetical protein